jgi:hypothetical protein
MLFRRDTRSKVFGVAGALIILVTLLILCEKWTFLPKPITRFIL